MSDPFFGLNINNLQTISAANNTRLHDMNHSMTKPLMSSHLPQLPQQQMKTSAPNLRSETSEQQLDERKKFEKYRKFQIQQKRLQEMSFTSGVPASNNSSADKLMANLIQKVESEAKIDKRMQNSHKTGLHVYNQPIGQPSGAVQSPNKSLYRNQLGTVGQQNAVALQPLYLSGQQLPQQQNSSYFNSFYPSNQMSKNSIQQMTTSGLESISHSTLSSVSDELKGCPQQMASNQTMTSMNPITDFNLSSNSDPIFSITSTNCVNTGVTNSNTEPITSAIRPLVVQKLPNCFEDLSKIPALYIKVWNYVKVNDISNVCDTNRVYPVLLSVGLPQTTLAKLWSVVNQTIPGQLTRHELNMALALIALIQKNSPNPLQEVYKLDSLPIPTIQLFDESNDKKTSFPEVLQISTEIPTNSSEITLNANNFDQNVSNTFELTKNFHQNEQNLSKLCQKFENQEFSDKTIDDDFDDFKSADFSSICSTVSQTVNDFKPKQLSNSMIESPVNNPIEEDFDDFKSSSFIDSNQTKINISLTEPQESVPEMKTNTHSLSDALMSNISAISSVINSTHISNQTLSSTPIASKSSSLSQSSTNCTPSPQSDVSSEQMTDFNPNFTSVDKYSVFRELSTVDNTKEEDFGNFLSHPINCDAESVDSLQFGHQDNNDNNDNIESMSFQIIQTCRQIIHKTFNVLVVNHGEDSVIEAIRSSQGNQFAFDLLEVYEIIKRVEKNLKSRDKLSINLIKLIEEIDNTWNSITSVFKKASINMEINDEIEINCDSDENSSHCAICNSKGSPHRPVLTFAGHQYHISCANLWLNCINLTLPQPLIYIR